MDRDPSSHEEPGQERGRPQQARQGLLLSPRDRGDGGSLMELSQLRVQVKALESERDMRVKLEKLLEVQTVQVDLQKELRVKTESLLQVEQQTSSKLRQQVDELRRAPGTGAESHLQLEDRFREAQTRIRALEKQLAEMTAPETSDRVESHLRLQIEEQERIIRRLQEQMEGQARPTGPAAEGNVVRLQLLLQSRDKHLDELTQNVRKAQNDSAEAQSEADVLRHQVRVLKKEVSERTEEMERQLNCERNLRADIFQLQGKLERQVGLSQEEARRCGNFAERAAHADDLQRRVDQLERQLAEEQTTSRREREQFSAEAEHRAAAKEQVIKHQTTTIESLSRELKERQAELDKLLHLGGEEPAPAADLEQALQHRERGGLLPPLQSPSPRGEGGPGQRSLESLHRQLKAKDVKIAKQSERLQALGEMLEKRDQQLEELSTARRDRDHLQQRVSEMEEVLKAQPRVVTHAEAERRLIEQERRMQGGERQAKELNEALQRERGEREALRQELSALRGHLADGASSSGALQEENARLSAELAEANRLLDGRTEELRRLREARASEHPGPDPASLSALPALKRRLQCLEEVDRHLGRDVAVWLQERENKIESLNSTIVLLRSSLDDLRRSAAPAGATATTADSLLAAPAGPAPSGPTAAERSRALCVEGQPPGGPSAQQPPRSVLGRDALLPPSAVVEAVDMQAALSPTAAPQEAARQPSARSPRQVSGEQAAAASARTLRAAPEATQASTTGVQVTDPQGRLHANPMGREAARPLDLAPPTAPPTRMPVALEGILTTEDIRTTPPEEIRQELIARRQESWVLEQQLEEKRQLVSKLVEEANLCNAEVASLQQTVQQAQKAAKKQDREHEKVKEEKSALEKLTKHLQQTLTEKETKLAKIFTEHQQETSGNANIDEVDQKVGWKLQMLVPRQHEIRHSVFLVLNRRQTETLDKVILAQGLAHHFAIAASRIEIVEDARLPDQAVEGEAGEGRQTPSPRCSTGGAQLLRDGDLEGDLDEAASKRDLVLVNIVDSEVVDPEVGDPSSGTISRSLVSALDVLDQVRNDMLGGHRIGPIDGILVDAIFINHGDILLPFEWPAAQARLLLREGRVLAGKHAVITVHEVCDPYTLRIVAYDTEAGHEFILHLNARDVVLLLDTRDSEAGGQAQPAPNRYRHLEGPCVSLFKRTFSVAEPGLLDIIVSSLSFSVWQNQQILVASEMRIPSAADVQRPRTASAAHDLGRSPAAPGTAEGTGPAASALVLPEDLPPPGAQLAALLPERGLTRGLRPTQRKVRPLFEDVLGFEGRLCIFSLVHTTTDDLTEDMLRASMYYPKTSSLVEACLADPMLTDRMRIIAEAGELDTDEAFSVAIVVEEVIYPPAFVVRITSITLADAYSTSPQEAFKPHTHIIRVSKDDANALHIPDISFAVSPSTLRTKLLRCIGVSTMVQCPRETDIKLPSVNMVTDQSSEEVLEKRAVSGHVDESSGLRVQLKSKGLNQTLSQKSECKPGVIPPAMRAMLRAKYGKGRLVKRQGTKLSVRGNQSGEWIRVVVSVYERSQPYQHLVICAYEPQTSREWEVLSDSIDVFKLFADRDEGPSQALDLANPATREKLADTLVRSVELVTKDGELMLAVSPTAVREHVEAGKRAVQREREQAPEVAGREACAEPAAITAEPHSAIEPFDVQPVASRTHTLAIGGFTGGFDRENEVLVEQHGRDRLFTAQRRLAPAGKGPGDLYTVQIYDVPSTVALHSYLLVAKPLDEHPLATAGLPRALDAEGRGPPAPANQPHYRTYVLKVDDRMLEEFLWGNRLLEPSRQEELLNYIAESVHLDEDKSGQLRICLRRKKPRAHQIEDAIADIGQTGANSHAAHNNDPSNPGAIGSREIGGVFPLNRLRINSKLSNSSIQGPSLQGTEDPGLRKMLVHEWKKIYCMAQRFGTATVIVTVSKQNTTYKLGVYEPELSALYEMTMVTCSSSTPMNVLMERCELVGKVDLMLCMNEIAFPHQLQIVLLHLPTGQEFNLKIGDDMVFTMVENSRREAFTHFFEQLITWGCIGFASSSGVEERVFDETFAGNQIFDRMQVEDTLTYHLNACVEMGELKPPNALAPHPPKKTRVPVVRTQLDFLGKKAPPTHGISMHLLFQAEHVFQHEQQALLVRVHKRAQNNDVAVTLRVRNSHGLSLPQEPQRGLPKPEPSAGNGRPFDTPALALGEARGYDATETTIWLQDKCSRAPCGAYAEICDVPGFPKPVLIFITDEDIPRSIRIAVTLAQLPFTVLFQVVLLETSETSAKVEVGLALKTSSNRKVMQHTFQRYFGKKSQNTPAVLTHLADMEADQRDRNLRQRLRELDTTDGQPEHLGFEYGDGLGGPLADGRVVSSDEQVSVAILHMTTRRKLGRMMVFTVYRDIIASNMYLRVVMHDPVAQRDSHLTLLHYTTQRLLSLLRISRDMLEEHHEREQEFAKHERQQLRAELGKLIVDHLFLQRLLDKEGSTEEIDQLELSENEDVEYELRMRDIMDSSNSSELTVKQKLLTLASEKAQMQESQKSHGSEGMMRSLQNAPPLAGGGSLLPRTLLDVKEDHLLHKGEKEVSGRRVLVTFYSETTKEDILNYSHNIRIIVACVQTLNVLVAKDFHEDTLEFICARRGKRHLMSATREQDLVRELWECLSLEHTGQKVTGITFAGVD